MKKLNTIIAYTLPLLILLVIPSLLMAQPPEPGPEPTPIDGGLSLLIAGGVAYGAKKVRDARRGRK